MLAPWHGNPSVKLELWQWYRYSEPPIQWEDKDVVDIGPISTHHQARQGEAMVHKLLEPIHQSLRGLFFSLTTDPATLVAYVSQARCRGTIPSFTGT